MTKYRFKTKEEFIRDGLWNDKYDCPDEWAWEGQMNKFLGIDVPDELNIYCNKKEDFQYDGWYFKNNEYVLKEQQEYFDDLSQHIGRYIRALVDNPHLGSKVKKGDIGKIISSNRADFPNFKSYSCSNALTETNLGIKYELLPEDYSPEQEDVPERISFYVRYTKEFTEDLYNALLEWSKKNSKFSPRNWDESYEGLKRCKFYIFDNWSLESKEKYVEIPSSKYSYGVDNNRQNCKEEYTIEQVKKLIGYKKPSIEFIPGKWYKLIDCENAYRKCSKIPVENRLPYSELIGNGSYRCEAGSSGDLTRIKLVEDLSEIQEYLPEGHPDKVKAIDLKVGKWYSFNWDYFGKDRIVIAKIKEVTEKDFIISWRNYLWRDKSYSDDDSYEFKDISNIKELSIDEVQQYLPEGHPDKITKQKFEIGKWYKWYQKNHGNYHYGKVNSIDINTDTLVMSPWIMQCTDYMYSGTFDLSKAEQIQEISVEDVQEFLPKNHSDKITSNEFKKGEYIVIIKMIESYSKDFTSNYIYKQREDYKHLRSELDNYGSTTNGWETIGKKDSHTWRYATQEEIDEYERRGKPYDVTKLQKKELSMEEIQEECKKRFPIGCTYINTSGNEYVLKEDFYTYSIVGKQIWAHSGADYLYENGRWAELVSLSEENITEVPKYVECFMPYGRAIPGKVYKTTDENEAGRLFGLSWKQVLIDFDRLEDGSFKISNKEAYEQQKPLIYDSVSGCFPTDKKMFIFDEVGKYPSTASNYWTEIPKFVEQDFDIYGPTPDIE